MSEIRGLAQQLSQLFAGCERAHGTCEISEQKRIAAITVRKPVTEDVWAEHLSGGRNLGVVPNRDDGFCSWGAIDVDSTSEVDLADLAKRIHRSNLPLVACRSKGGGAHLYLFSRRLIRIGEMQDRLRYCAKRLGHSHAEVFPKQANVDVARGDIGSWILMPYFNANYTNRYAVNATGDKLDAEQFLELATAEAQF